MSKRFAVFVYTASFLFFGCFFIWPIWKVIQGGFFDERNRFTLRYVAVVFQNPVYIEGILNALKIGIGSTVLSLCLAVPLACLYNKYEFFGKKAFAAAVLLPLILPPFVGVNGFLQLLGTYGTLNTLLMRLGWLTRPIDWVGAAPLLSIMIVNALSLYPILYLNIVAALANLDPTLSEVAENLGCRGFRKFRTVTFPLIRPGVFAGCTIVFIWSFTELGVPLMFNFNRVLSVQIYHGLREIGSSPFPYALVGVLFVLSATFYLLGKRYFGKNGYAMLAKASHGRTCCRLNAFQSFGCMLIFVLVTGLALAPHLAVILFSFAADWYQTILPVAFTKANYLAALGDSITIPSIQNNLIYASGATVISILLGIGVAFAVVRTQWVGRQWLDTCAMMPLAVPSLVVAFGLLAMTQDGCVFSFLNPTKNPTLLLIIAYAVRKVPLMVRSSVAGLQQISVTYEEAAQSLGCTAMKAACRITVPLIAANLIAGAILVFSQAMLEVSDSLVLAQKRAFYPVTKAIYELMNFLGSGTFLSCALGVWAMTFLAVTIIGASALLGKSFGSIFKV